ncbi:MAG: hypothetical protein AAB354_15425, partial [candidate division KSB1 bacterium]
MKLTPFGKLFVALVAISVIGFVAYEKFGAELRDWAGAAPLSMNSREAGDRPSAQTTSRGEVTH